MDNPRSFVRSCIDCGRTFKSHHRRCTSCSAREHACIDCGEVFRGDRRRCLKCLSRQERTCKECGRSFRGVQNWCQHCRAAERDCAECGRTFTGNTRTCDMCKKREKPCATCGETFFGYTSSCRACQVRERACIECGATFHGWTLRCYTCYATERTCGSCGEAFNGHTVDCPPCRWKSLPPEIRQAMAASANNARRARKRNAEVAGPVPPEIYEAIQASGPCVYCGSPAGSVDHVRPLIQGGWEHESNLVPACKSCNFSKGGKLLTEWGRAVRVAHGIAHSPKVAAEYDRLTLAAA